MFKEWNPLGKKQNKQTKNTFKNVKKEHRFRDKRKEYKNH